MKVLQHGSQARSEPAPTIIGNSPALTRVITLAARIAGGSAKVLITGESGVGKDVFARYIHAHSAGAGARYVALNCAAFSETLLESELFGHVKGSFTGAYRDKMGKLQQAHRGTIFLDEIGEMSLRMQVMLLRFLENGEIQPVGSDTPAFNSDVRVISATNRDLQEMVAKGEFREDLLYRIRVAHLHVPPLRERKEDVRALIDFVLEKTGRTHTISEAAYEALAQYRWPGNVRELQNVVEQMAAICAGTEIGIDDLPASIAAREGSHLYPRRERRRRVSDDLFEGLVSGKRHFWDDVHALFTNRDITRADVREVVRRALAATRGNYRAVVELLGMSPSEYKKFLNFLAAHDCVVDYREYRQGMLPDGQRLAPPDPHRPAAANM